MRGWIKSLAAAFVAIIAGTIISVIPPLPGWFARVDAHHTAWLIVTCIIAGSGFVLMMGGILVLIIKRGDTLSHEEAEDVSRSVRMVPLQPTVVRASSYKVWGEAQGQEAHDQFSFRDMKDAWRQRAWRHDPVWRHRFITSIGALFMAVGIAGICFTLSPAAVKVIVVAALVYATTRIVRGFRRA